MAGFIPIARISATIIMSRVKDYYGEKFLNKEENIKLDFIHAELENNYEKNAQTLSWCLTINTGKTDDKGYVDALIIEISNAQYPSFFEVPEGEFNTVEFKTIQLPDGMTQQQANELIFKLSKEIDLAIEEFEKDED